MVHLEDVRVTALGHSIGFGRVMQAAEAAWKRIAVEGGTPGSEHTTGPCATFMVRCPHFENDAREQWFDRHGHCEWCCGAGRVTERVAKAMRK